MTPGTRRVPGHDQDPAYFDYRRIDPTDPDFKSIIDFMVDRHPDPLKSKKGLCADARLSVDSFRKYMGGTFGPGIGLIDLFMRLTGNFMLLNWLARRHGFLLVQEPDIRWDQRKRLKTDNELDRIWVELRSLLHSLDYQPGKNGKNLKSSCRRDRNQAIRKARVLMEQLVGLQIALENINPQIDLFTTGED